MWKHITLSDFVAIGINKPISKQFDQITKASELCVIVAGLNLYYVADSNKTIDNRGVFQIYVMIMEMLL